MKTKNRILIVDAEKESAARLCAFFNAGQYQVEAAHTLQEGCRKLRRFDVQVLLLDIRLSEFLTEFSRLAPQGICVLMTDPQDVELALELLNGQAYDYLEIPIEPRRLRAVVKRCCNVFALREENASIERALQIKTEEVDEINMRLRAMVESIREFSTDIKIQRMGKALLEQFAYSMAAEGGSLYVLKQDALELAFALDSGHAPKKISFPLTKGSVFDRVIHENQPILIKDIEQEERIVRSGWSGYRNGSLLVFPLSSVTGRVVGLLTLHNKVCPPFTPQDNEIGRILAFYCCEVLRATHALEDLQISETRYRSIFENIQDIYFELLPDGTLLEISPSVRTILRYRREDVRHKSLRDFLASPVGIREFMETILQQKQISDYEISLVDSQGSVVPCSMTAQVLTDEQGAPWKICGTLRDIRKRKRAEEALRHLNKELEERVQSRTTQWQEANTGLREALDMLNKTQEQLVQSEKMVALGNLVAGVTHEISTPLGVSLTAASHLEHQTREVERLYLDGKMTRSALELYLRSVKMSTRSLLTNLQRAIEHIRGFKRMAVDQAGGKKRHFKLSACIDDVLLSLHPTLRKTRHKVSVHCPPNLEVYSYPGAISQILTNLVINTLLHGFEHKEQGSIRLDVANERNALVLSYHDNGRGMTEEERSRMYEPFYTTKQDQGGSGLGLAIVYNLVTQQLQGRIDCETEPGKGTGFTIRIPFDKGML